MINEEIIWSERYRPHTVEETILPLELKTLFKNFVKQRTIPNLLFSGGPGMGKTTIARAMCEELRCDYIIINGSLEGNIDTLRNKIANFASTVSFSGGRKYVIIDECLDENTLVTILRKGKIQNIKISELNEKEDLVKSFNIKENKIEWKPFLLFNKETQETVEIEFENNEKIICTLDHKWYVYDENNNPIIVKTSELYKYNYILTEEDNVDERTQTGN